MSQLGIHNNNEWEQHNIDLIEEPKTREDVLENDNITLKRKLDEANKRTRYMKEQFEAIAKICDLRHFQHGTLNVDQLRQIETIVEPYP